MQGTNPTGAHSPRRRRGGGIRGALGLPLPEILATLLLALGACTPQAGKVPMPGNAVPEAAPAAPIPDLALRGRMLPELGEPLPPDGGEPARVWAEWNAALLAGDFAELKALSPARDQDDPIFAPDGEARGALAAELSLGALREARYLGGLSQGDDAWLEYEGTDGRGEIVAQEVGMEREGAHWKVAWTWKKPRP